jgi:hypothetical protein
MSIKKLVVASLAVVGTVGMVGAVDSPIGTNELLPSPATGEMSVSYEVQLLASMAVTSKSLKGDKLLCDPTIQTNFGNLGDVVVRTNYPRWDVTVDAANKLILRKGSVTTMNPGSPPLVAPFPETVEGDALLADAATGDSAMLNVSVGIVTGALPVFTATRASLTSDLSGASGKASFAVAIGDQVDSDNIDDAGNPNMESELGSAIKAKGFGQQTDYQAGVQFFLTGNLVKANDATLAPLTKIDGKNKNGTYEETLTFTLVAGF